MTDLPDKLDEILDEFQAQIQDGYTQPVNGWTTLKQEAKAQINQLRLQDRITGMRQARDRIIRRTEIPADARNPTRDAIVILGEEIAHIITKDIEALKTREEQYRV